MRLLIVSHTPHYRQDGRIVGFGPTLREIDALAGRFDQVVHIAPLHPTHAPGSSSPYTASNIRFRAVAPSGGHSFQAKLSILQRIPDYLRAIHEEAKHADVIHVRCPANISLVVLLWLIVSKHPRYRWVKYAGNWNPPGKEAFSYTLQRWILQRNLHRGIVTVNGEWEGQPAHIYSFYNPSLTAEERENAAKSGCGKQLTSPVRLLFVGRLEAAKGVGEVLSIASRLKAAGVAFELDLVGDGPEKRFYHKQAQSLQISQHVRFHGWQPRSCLGIYYQKSHFILLPSIASEGWPKVLSEAMAYGAVPMASTVSSISQILAKCGTGFAFPAPDGDRYVDAIRHLAEKPDEWKALSAAGIRAAEWFAYDHYLHRLEQMFNSYWGINLC